MSNSEKENDNYAGTGFKLHLTWDEYIATVEQSPVRKQFDDIEPL